MDSTFGLLIVAAVLIGLGWMLSQLLSRTDRNADPGNGYDASQDF